MTRLIKKNQYLDLVDPDLSYLDCQVSLCFNRSLKLLHKQIKTTNKQINLILVRNSKVRRF